jgi:multidrug resistance efflux pump
VQANVIEIAPRVSGPIAALTVKNNQFVHAGDLLFEIDPRTFQASLDQAKAQLDQTSGDIKALVKQVEGAKAGLNVARALINQARSAIAQTDAMIAKDRAEYDRQQQLLPKKATSQKSVDRAKATFEISRQDKKVAQAAEIQAEENLLKAQARWPKPKPN